MARISRSVIPRTPTGQQRVADYFEVGLDRRAFAGTKRTLAIRAMGHLSAALSQLVQLLRKLEVLLGDPVLRVADERDARESRRQEDVGIMIQLVGDRRELVHELDRTGEVVELELASEAVAVLLPAVTELCEPSLYVFIAQNGHLSASVITAYDTSRVGRGCQGGASSRHR